VRGANRAKWWKSKTNGIRADRSSQIRAAIQNSRPKSVVDHSHHSYCANLSGLACKIRCGHVCHFQTRRMGRFWIKSARATALWIGGQHSWRLPNSVPMGKQFGTGRNTAPAPPQKWVPITNAPDLEAVFQFSQTEPIRQPRSRQHETGTL
jgi:hypothetical protein